MLPPALKMMTQQQPQACSRRCLQAAPAAAQHARRAVCVPAATNKHTNDFKAANTAAARLACATAAAAAALVAATPAAAAGNTPSYPAWSFFDMTPYQVELFFDFADCDSQFGGTLGAYQQFTYPFPRGACNVATIHATAFVQDTPGGDPRIVATADWSPSAPNSQEYSWWVVMQLAAEDPNIRVAHTLD